MVTLIVSVIGALTSLVILHFMVRQRNPRPVLIAVPRFEAQHTPADPRDTLTLKLELRNPGIVAIRCRRVELQSESLSRTILLDRQPGDSIAPDDSNRAYFAGKVPEEAADLYEGTDDIPVKFRVYCESGRSSKLKRVPCRRTWNGVILARDFQCVTGNRT